MNDKDAVRGGAEQMRAGREMDALVAERVMGGQRPSQDPSDLPWDSRHGGGHWCVSRRVDTGVHCWTYQGPAYSTDIAAAWEVVGKMGDDGWLWDIRRFYSAWSVRVRKETDEGEARWVNADAAPIAICRAALVALAVAPTPPEQDQL